MLKDLLAERANVWEQMKAIRDKANGESRAEFSAEEATTWDKLEARLAELSAQIERDAREERLSKLMSSNPVVSKVAEAASEVEPSEQYREAFVKWARYGSGELEADEKRALRTGFVAAQEKEFRALGIGTGAAGGYAVPQGFRDYLVETMKYFSSMRDVATVITTTEGNTLPWPTNNDTANVGAILAENTQITQQDVALNQQQLGAYMYTSKLVLVSYQLLQDSAINIETFLGRKLGQRIGRIQNQHFTTGTGSSQPLGLITGGTAVQAGAGNVTGFTYDELVNAIFRVDPAYRQGPNIRWMFSDSVMAGLRKMKDSQNRPLWEPSLQVGTPDSFLGYRIMLNNDLPVPAANAKSAAFGDFTEGYVIRDVSGVQTVRLDERYADFLQVGWFAYARTDATVQDTAAYTVLQNSAT